MASVYNLQLAAPLAALRERSALVAGIRAAGGTLAAAGKVLPWVSVFSENPEALASLPGVLYIEQDSGCEECAPVSPSSASERSGKMEPWHLRMIEAERAWTRSRGAGAKIAIIDTGVLLAHPELRGARISAETFVPTEGPDDSNGHGLGTHGFIAGQGPVVYGIAPEAEIYSLKALDKKGRGRWSWIALAVERATELHADVAVMALGGDGRSHMLEDALRLYTRSGGLAVAAAGNDSASHLDYPGSSAYAVSVASVGKDGKRAPWSSWAPWPSGPDISAPGVDVPAIGFKGYKKLSGTSVSAAIAGGILALRKLPKELGLARQAIHNASVGLAVSRERGGYGLLDAARYVGA